MKKLHLLFFLAFSISSFSQSDKELAESAVSQNLIKSHIYFLASDELKGRDTPSEGLSIAAKYIESRFMEYGVDPAPSMNSYFQLVPMKKEKPSKVGAIKIGKTELKRNTDFVVLNGDQSLFDQPFVFVGHGNPDDLQADEVKGKIVFAICGDGESQNPQEWFIQGIEKRKQVKALGGLALVELYNSPQLPWNFLVRFLSQERVSLDEGEENGFLHVWVNRSVDDTSFLDKDKPVSLAVAPSKVEKFTSQNLVGYVAGSDPKLKNEVVVYSAHYDHVGVGAADAAGDSIYNGSRDNAVGTVTVLAAAQNIARYPTKRSALFVLFTGEEKGLLGSQYFVDHAPVELPAIVYCFNSDNGGYNDTTKATIIGLTRTTAGEMIREACRAFGLEAIEDPAPEQGLFDRSDNVRFAAKGIPAPTFSMGFTAFDEEIMKYYHQPGDNPNTLDYEYLEKFFKSYVYSCRLIGNSKKAPFWVKGDKYYEAGKELYK